MLSKSIGRYKTVDVLGHGGYGIVYLADDTFLTRQVALKVIEVRHPQLCNDYLREALIQAQLSHANIVTIHNAGLDGRSLYIDMELMHKDLSTLLDKQRKLSISHSLDMCIQILHGLHAAHEQNIVHRDIKPKNILLKDVGTAKLGDFGIARTLATNEYIGGAGTFDYTAPEGLLEDKHCDRRSDLWSVGVVLYEMLTGHMPFSIPRTVERAERRVLIQQNKPTPLKMHCGSSSDALQAIIECALSF